MRFKVDGAFPFTHDINQLDIVIMTNDEFRSRTDVFYKELRELSDHARKTVREFISRHNGAYEFNPDDDLPWVGDDRFATKIIQYGNGNVDVFNSAGYSENLDKMDQFNTLDLAEYVIRIED